MSRRILSLGICAFLIVGCYCASIKKANMTGIRNTKFCTDENDTEFKLAMGEQAPSPKGSCRLVKCENVVDGKSIFTAIGCGVFVPTTGCNATDYDYSKRYPDCCPSEVCSTIEFNFK